MNKEVIKEELERAFSVAIGYCDAQRIPMQDVSNYCKYLHESLESSRKILKELELSEKVS